MRVALAKESPEGYSSLRQVVHGLGFECATEDCTSFASLELRLLQAPAVDLLIVIVDENPAAALEAIREATRIASCPVLAVGPSAETSSLRQLKSESRAYLDRKSFRDELIEVLAKLRREGAVHQAQGRAIVVTSAAPGAGVTTIAAGLAFAMAAKRPREVLLTEMGTCVPELALNLGFKPEHSLSKLLTFWDRLDRSVIQQAVCVHPAGADVLPQYAGLLKPVPMSPQAVRSILTLLKALYAYVIVDVGHSLSESVDSAIRQADGLVVVTRLDVPSLQLCRAYLKRLVRGDVPLKRIHVVVNREGVKQQIALKRAQDALQVPIVETIPDDAAAVVDALNHGQPLIELAPRAHITQHLGRLAQHLSSAMDKEAVTEADELAPT